MARTRIEEEENLCFFNYFLFLQAVIFVEDFYKTCNCYLLLLCNGLLTQKPDSYLFRCHKVYGDKAIKKGY